MSSTFRKRIQRTCSNCLRTPRSDDERSTTASACAPKLAIEIPAILGGIDNKTKRAYTGWPDRLYLIGREGRLISSAARGRMASRRRSWNRLFGRYSS